MLLHLRLKFKDMANITAKELRGFTLAFIIVCLLCAVAGAGLMYVYLQNQYPC